MNVDRILKALTLAADPTSESYRAAQSKSAGWPAELRARLFPWEASGPVRQALVMEDEFREGAGFILRRDNGARRFAAEEAAAAILRRTMRSNDPSEAIKWLLDLLSRNSETGIGVMVLSGISVKEPCQLTKDVMLLPISALPESSAKEWLLRPRDPAAIPGLPWSLMTPPKAAVTVRETITPLLHDNRKGDFPSQDDPFRLHSLLDEARLALTVIGPSAPLDEAYWFQFDDSDLNEAASGGITTSGLDVLPWPFANEVELDLADAQAVVSRYLSLDGSIRNRLRIALGRLNQALRRRPSGDKAIDLCIALEAILVDGVGENTYKVGLRAALLLPCAAADRILSRGLIGALYTVRSAVLHSGLVPKQVKVVSQGKKTLEEIMSHSTNVCADVVRSLITRGTFPDWYTLEACGS